MECPAWAIEANKITHDKKRQIIYDDAILKIYNMPVMYKLTFSSRSYCKTSIWIFTASIKWF